MNALIKISCRCGYKDSIYMEHCSTKEESINIDYRYYVFDHNKSKLIKVTSKYEIENPQLIKETDIQHGKLLHCPKCNENQAKEMTLSVRRIFCSM